jgi:hypothetical protein
MYGRRKFWQWRISILTQVVQVVRLGEHAQFISQVYQQTHEGALKGYMIHTVQIV